MLTVISIVSPELLLTVISIVSPELPAAIEARSRTGRPLASPELIAEAEAAIDRKLGPQKRGPKPRGVGGGAN